MKKDTENLDILLLLKSQQLHRVAPFSVPSRDLRLFLYALFTTIGCDKKIIIFV